MFAGHRQNDPDEVEVEQEEHELAVVRQPIREVYIVIYHGTVQCQKVIHKKVVGTLEWTTHPRGNNFGSGCLLFFEDSSI